MITGVNGDTYWLKHIPYNCERLIVVIVQNGFRSNTAQTTNVF